MISHDSTSFALVVAAYTTTMSGAFARAFWLYFRGDRYWTGNMSIGMVMLLLMVMSLL